MPYPQSRLATRLFLTSAITTLGVLSFTAHAHATNGLPSNGVVTNGTATLDYSTANELHVNTATDFVSINWDDFNIGQGNLTQFHQLSSSSTAVNRVVQTTAG